MKSFLALIFFLAVVSCANPGSPANGRRQGNDFSFGKRVTYVCNRGYVLEGDERRTCGKDGEWTGDLPSCESKYFGQKTRCASKRHACAFEEMDFKTFPVKIMFCPFSLIAMHLLF